MTETEFECGVCRCLVGVADVFQCCSEVSTSRESGQADGEES